MQQTLIKALNQVDRPGEICTAGDRPLTMPGLIIKRLGAVRLPLGEAQARELIELCVQAPYGKGTETLVDLSVRCAWELDQDQCRFTNPRWDQLIDSIVEEVQQKLGLEECRLSAHLHKLLVYEEDNFFLPHRDGEKLDRMVATLVIVLPTEFEGGELIISHQDQQYEVTFPGAASGFELSYAAFYADCQHEVKPVTSGYRLCLSYNLVLANGKRSVDISAPSFDRVSDEIRAVFANWRIDMDAQKLAFKLEHRYTRDGLTLDKLKGIDRTRASVLFEAAERASCIAHLAIITLWLHGDAEDYRDDYSRDYVNRHSRIYNEAAEELGENDQSEYEMGEIYNSSLSADYWTDRHGNQIGFGEIPLDESEIVSEAPIDDGRPDEEEFEGYTGNAGMTMERWYHRAAVVVWPHKTHLSVLNNAGTDAAIGGLAQLIAQLEKVQESQRDSWYEECLVFAEGVIDGWQPSHDIRARSNSSKSHRNLFPGMLYELDDPDLVQRFLSKALVVEDQVQLDTTFVEFCQRHGWKRFEADLLAVMQSPEGGILARNATLVQTLCLVRGQNKDRLKVCARLCNELVRSLKIFDDHSAQNPWPMPNVDRKQLLVSLVCAMSAIDTQSSLRLLVNHTLANLDTYDLTDAHLAAIFTLASRRGKLNTSLDAVSHWLASCRKILEKRTVNEPPEPADYRRNHELSCDCMDCTRLSEFLADPNLRECRFPLNKERRRHLHGIIDLHRCDLQHVTERTGRPFTLICTKTTASWKRARKIYKRDLKNLSKIIDLAKRRSPRDSAC